MSPESASVCGIMSASAGGLDTRGPPWVCLKALPVEGGVLLRPGPSLQNHYTVLWRLVEQRSILCFIQDYTKRVGQMAAFRSRMKNLLDHQEEVQTPSRSSSCGPGLVSLSQELRVHLDHWRCLLSRVQSDHYLRYALGPQNKILEEMKQTLNLLGLQLLVLMERYVYGVLCSLGQTGSDCLPRDVLEDVVAGTDLYNGAVEKHRTLLCVPQQRMAALQHLRSSKVSSGVPDMERHHPTAFSVKQLLTTLAAHHAVVVAEQLSYLTCEQNHHACKAGSSHRSCSEDLSKASSCGISTGRPTRTWEQLWQDYIISSPLLFNNRPTTNSLAFHTANQTPVNRHEPDRAKPSVRQEGEKLQASHCQASLTQTSREALDQIQPSLEEKISSTNACRRLSSLHLCQLDGSSIELLLNVLVSSTELLDPLAFHRPTAEGPAKQTSNCKADPVSVGPPLTLRRHPEELNKVSSKPNKCPNPGGTPQGWTKPNVTARQDATDSFGALSDSEEKVRTTATTVKPAGVRQPPFGQSVDFGQSLLVAELLEHYHTLLWIHCSKALWLKLRAAQTGINLQGEDVTFHVLHRITHLLKTGSLPEQSRTTLEDFILNLLVETAHAHWDSELCRSSSSALKDKCVRSEGSSFVASSSSSKRDGGAMMSQTMESFLLLLPPVVSSLCCHQSSSWASGSEDLLPSRSALQRRTVGLVSASVQLSTVWVMSKAFQFLSSWSPKKFLLVTQGDLKVLMDSLNMVMPQTKSLTTTLDTDRHSTIHNQHLLRQQLHVLDTAVFELQTFSSLVLKNFSIDCKRVSEEIFERTMPSAAHWKPNSRTAGFPSSPSAYAPLAAQTVIGQVLEVAAGLSEDARVQALSITMTAFMEAWMEHILKHKIKFSVQGALQLKQDFDSVREMIQSDQFALSAELHQRLLNLRVFHQVDSAVICLLQQPQKKPNPQSRDWDLFTRCCPASRTRDSIDAAVGNNITYLGCVEGEDLTQPDPSFGTSDLSPLDPSSPAEPYLAPSVALGAAQQEWLDLRMQSGIRRWRLPGLQCLFKTEA